MSVWNQYALTWDDGQRGFGINSYEAARNAGYTNAQIRAGTAGQRIGKRALDMIDAGLKTEYKLQKDIDSARSEAAGYKSQISGYQDQLNSYQGQLNNYMSQVNTLSGQYQTALSRQQEIQTEADKWQSDFRDMSSKYETEKAEADRYREEAVGRQLQAVRSGATTGGSPVSVGAGYGSLARGGQSYQRGRTEDAITKASKAEGGLTDSVLDSKGPVVEQMNSATRRQTAPTGRPNQGLASGRTSGYYSSRFS